MFIEYSLIKEFILELVYIRLLRALTVINIIFPSLVLLFDFCTFSFLQTYYVTAGGKPTVIAGVDMKSERGISENK